MNSPAKKNNLFYLLTILVTTAFTIAILFTENEFLWYCLIAALLIFQIKFKNDATILFPLVAILTLTEFYFIISEKRVYLCEFLYYPLLLKFFLSDFLWKKGNYIKLTITLLSLLILLFQTFNFFLNSDLLSSFFRIRSFVFPLFLVVITESLVKTKEELKYILNLIIFFSFIGTAVLVLQFITGRFYILQNSAVIPDDLNFIEGYLSATQDSFLFNLLGLHIKGPMPPVGLNYFKFGYSEKIIVPVSLFFSYFLYNKEHNKRNLFLFFILVFATLLTGSRSVLLTFLFIMLILFLFKNNKLKWGFIQFTIIFFFAITYMIAPLLNFINLEEFGTLASRMFYLNDFFNFIANYPKVLFAGSSPVLFLTLAKSEQPPHHFFAFGTMYDGLIVTSIFFYMVYKLLKSTYKINNMDNELVSISHGLWASIFGFVFIYGQTSYLTWNTPHNMFFCIVAGLLLATNRIAKKAEISISKD